MVGVVPSMVGVAYFMKIRARVHWSYSERSIERVGLRHGASLDEAPRLFNACAVLGMTREHDPAATDGMDRSPSVEDRFPFTAKKKPNNRWTGGINGREAPLKTIKP